MKINLLSFGIAQDIVGNRSVQLTIKNDSLTVGDLKSQLVIDYPRLGDLTRFVLAVNSEYATDQTVIKSGDEIAIIPPTSGG